MRARSPQMRRLRATVAAMCLSLAAAVLSGLLAPPASGVQSSSGPVIPTPLATSIQSSAGTWATLPMGILNQPLNTFWQLFFRPTGATSWSNKVEATAVATNGGLVLASASGQPFIAGVRPSNLLTYSPLIYTSDGGHSWSNGLIPEGLAARPDALSTSTDGQTLALVDGSGGQVLTGTGGLSSWHTRTAVRQLASGGGGRACGIRTLTAVADLAGDALVGASCSHRGVVGIFAERAGRWQLDRLPLPASLRRGRVAVLSMTGTALGLTALLGVTEKSATALFAAWTTSGGGWSVSPTLTLPLSGRLVSFGPTSGIGLFALTATPSGALRLAVIDGPGDTWNQMPPPPPDTATVAFGPGSSSAVDALATRDTTMTVWSLGSGSTNWVKTQVLPVTIEFGSSS